MPSLTQQQPCSASDRPFRLTRFVTCSASPPFTHVHDAKFYYDTERFTINRQQIPHPAEEAEDDEGIGSKVRCEGWGEENPGANGRVSVIVIYFTTTLSGLKQKQNTLLPPCTHPPLASYHDYSSIRCLFAGAGEWKSFPPAQAPGLFSSSSLSVIVTIVMCWSLLGYGSSRSGVDYQLIREVRPRVMKYTWLAPPGRTDAKKT